MNWLATTSLSTFFCEQWHSIINISHRSIGHRSVSPVDHSLRFFSTLVCWVLLNWQPPTLLWMILYHWDYPAGNQYVEQFSSWRDQQSSLFAVASLGCCCGQCLTHCLGLCLGCLPSWTSLQWASLSTFLGMKIQKTSLTTRRKGCENMQTCFLTNNRNLSTNQGIWCQSIYFLFEEWLCKSHSLAWLAHLLLAGNKTTRNDLGACSVVSGATCRPFRAV